MTAKDPEIDALLERMYAVISFEEGDEPNWHGLRELFSEYARITRVTPEGTDYLDPESFIAMTRNLVEVGAYTSFYEFEIARRVDCFGSIAQVWSLYETKPHRHAQEPLGRGLNSIQLIREAGTWRVLGLLWDETNADPNLNLNNTFNEE